MGNDINQIARHLNTAAKTGRPGDLAPHAEALATMAAEIARIAGQAEQLLAPKRRGRHR
jgi:hypothetical protein